MKTSALVCKFINQWIPLPTHPFNLNNKGAQTYAQWQFDRGHDTIQFYLKNSTIEDMFQNKVVLDIGCGAAGKTVYYASLGVKKIYGLEILEQYRREAENFAKEKGYQNQFRFVCEDASRMSFAHHTFDTIIMNDAMEHVYHPEQVLKECYRVLKPGGRLYLNFPPYNHPYGAHLSDAIGIPWVHCFFRDKTLIQVYKELVKDLPDGEQRIQFRIGVNEKGDEYLSYINKMSIERFHKVINNSPFHVMSYHEIPLRKSLVAFSKFPRCKEYFVKMVVCVLDKAHKY